jgi:hypothetical protein
MPDFDHANTFRGLPLTADQDAEVRNHIEKKEKLGEPWDTPEFDAMIKDMLEPPTDGDEQGQIVDLERQIEERAAATIDEAMEPIEADEELRAAMESEIMKGP